MSDDLRERLAAAMWNSRGNGDWNDATNTALVAIYRNLADAALAEIGAVSVREAARVLLGAWSQETVKGCQIRCEVAQAQRDEPIRGLKFSAGLRAIAEGKE